MKPYLELVLVTEVAEEMTAGHSSWIAECFDPLSWQKRSDLW